MAVGAAQGVSNVTSDLTTDGRSNGCGHKLWTFRSLFCLYRWRILLTYGLFNLENLLRLAQPFILGKAINDLIAFSCCGVVMFVILQFIYTLVSTLRQTYDTRVFTSIYTDLATRLVLEQRGHEVEASRVMARSALSREFVEFFEREIPITVISAYSVVGALVMLGLYDWMLAFFCLVLLVPAYILNSGYGRKTLFFNRQINDEFEREVEIISRYKPQEVRDHYALMAQWRIKLSDCQAINFSVMELFALGLIAAVLVRSTTVPGTIIGDIFAVFRYVTMFTMGLGSVPTLIAQFNRLRDIIQRMETKSHQVEVGWAM